MAHSRGSVLPPEARHRERLQEGSARSANRLRAPTRVSEHTLSSPNASKRWLLEAKAASSLISCCSGWSGELCLPSAPAPRTW